MIGKNDLKQVIQRLTGYNNALIESDIDQLITVETLLYLELRSCVKYVECFRISWKKQTWMTMERCPSLNSSILLINPPILQSMD